jgi:ABC-type multidrug transport system ATPase subunit
MNILEVKNLTVRVGSKIVLDNVSLRVKSQESHILFGPNGSGKTTLINAMMGTLSPLRKWCPEESSFEAKTSPEKEWMSGQN